MWGGTPRLSEMAAKAAQTLNPLIIIGMRAVLLYGLVI